MLLDLIGKEFGRLKVVSRSDNCGRRPRWNCVCSCGNSKTVFGDNLRMGRTKSCGCLHKESTSKANSTHLKTGSVEYTAWINMLSRCYNRNKKDFKNYGGRGITVCERWKEFENFYADMGNRPDNTSIDRIDVNGNYEPSNCRWASNLEQARNMRSNRLIEFNGIISSLSEHCSKAGLDYRSVHQRLKRGWNVTKALSTPIKQT